MILFLEHLQLMYKYDHHIVSSSDNMIADSMTTYLQMIKNFHRRLRKQDS